MKDENEACETPLLDLLRMTPKEAHAWHEINETHHTHTPYGTLCHRAADEIERLTAANAKLEQELKDAKEQRDFEAMRHAVTLTTLEGGPEIPDDNEYQSLANRKAKELRAKLTASESEVAGLRAALERVRYEVDGYIDGAPDAGPVAKLANAVSLIIDPPQM